MFNSKMVIGTGAFLISVLMLGSFTDGGSFNIVFINPIEMYFDSLGDFFTNAMNGKVS